MKSLKDTEKVSVTSAVKIYSDVGMFVTGMTHNGQRWGVRETCNF